MRKTRDDVGEKCYNERRSDLEPLERGRCMSSLLPWAPLARTLGVEEAYIYIYKYIYWGAWEAIRRRLIIHTEEKMKRASTHTHSRTHTCLQHTYSSRTYISIYKPTNPTPNTQTNKQILHNRQTYNPTMYTLTRLPTLQPYYCAVRSHLDIDEKLCAAIIICDFVRFGFCFENLLKKEMVLNSPHKLQFWHIAQPFLKLRIKKPTPKRTRLFHVKMIL